MRPVDIDIEPKLDVLQSLGFSEDDFEAALNIALEDLAAPLSRRLPTPGNIPIQLRGQEYRLGMWRGLMWSSVRAAIRL